MNYIFALFLLCFCSVFAQLKVFDSHKFGLASLSTCSRNKMIISSRWIVCHIAFFDGRKRLRNRNTQEIAGYLGHRVVEKGFPCCRISDDATTCRSSRVTFRKRRLWHSDRTKSDIGDIECAKFLSGTIDVTNPRRFKMYEKSWISCV